MKRLVSVLFVLIIVVAALAAIISVAASTGAELDRQIKASEILKTASIHLPSKNMIIFLNDKDLLELIYNPGK